ncbi:MAG TPA: hypothetical protein VMI53_01635 [Opitutaceae bacterium]|nr:hypothetical protein [Opitutaceae bacterium]
MNKFYFILPIVLLLAFIARYHQFSLHVAEVEHQHELELQQKQAEDQAAKEAAIKKAAADAAQREEEQRKADEQALADHLAKYQASMKQMADEKAKYQAEADRYAKQVGDLDIKLDQLHDAHSKASEELFDLQKQIEQAKIDRQLADLEIQRTYDMVTQKITASNLASYTPPQIKK